MAKEQVDRDAAANLLAEISSLLDHTGIGQVADLIRDGEYDEHEATLAFARHRLLGIEQGRAEMREEAAAFLDGYAGGHYMAKSCAHAIRAIPTAKERW